jgi:pimeloyl-ACP methyl ester carboxylesterase
MFIESSECDLKIFVNGHKLYIEQAGPENGPAVVLLHHGLGSVRAWRGQVPILAEAGFRVVTYDRWGYGESDSRPGLDVPSFSTDVKDLECLLELIGIQHTALIGHSDGGTIALYFSAEQPKKVSCLVTVAAHIYIETKMEPGILGLKQAFELDERFRLGMQYAHGEKFVEVFQNWYESWYQPDMLAWDMRNLLGKIICPALIIQGDADEHATPQHAMDIAGSIAGADLWLIPGAKHMLPQENTAEFNIKILRFLIDHVRVEQV